MWKQRIGFSVYFNTNHSIFWNISMLTFCATLSAIDLDDRSNRGYAYIYPGQEDIIDMFVEETLRCREIVGLNLVIVQGNKTLIAKGYGYEDRELPSFVDERTLFGIASLTKAFAATLLGILIDESDRWTWDSPVRDILGDDFYFHDILRTEKATIRDLLAHRTGVPPNNYARLQGLTRQQLAQRIRFFKATDIFRGSFIYNNLMYGLISHITEVIGGKSWEDLMTEKIFQPLGMSSTTFTHMTNLSHGNIAVPYLPYNHSHWKPVSWKLHRNWGRLGGSGSIMSNAWDMAKWLKMQLSLGLSERECRVVPKHIMEDLFRPSNMIKESKNTKLYRQPFSPVSYTFYKYALGWRVGSYRGIPIITHTGTSWGYGALITIIPDFDLAIYTSITGPDTGYKGRRNIHMFIMDVYLGLEPWLNLTTACTFPDRLKRKFIWIRKGVKPKLPLEKYIGVYGNFGYGNISITLPSGFTDRLRMNYGEMGVWDLYPTMIPNKFVADGLEDIWSMDMANVGFETSAQGDIVDKLVIASFERHNPPVFLRDLRMSLAPRPPERCPKPLERVVLMSESMSLPSNYDMDRASGSPVIHIQTSISSTIVLCAVFIVVVNHGLSTSV